MCKDERIGLPFKLEARVYHGFFEIDALGGYTLASHSEACFGRMWSGFHSSLTKTHQTCNKIYSSFSSTRPARQYNRPVQSSAVSPVPADSGR
jgi:hypothetical protein